MKRGAAAPAKKAYIEFETFLALVNTLLNELPSGRLSSHVLPPVVAPEVLQYTKQVDNVIERAMSTLVKFKKHKDADLAGLLAEEKHTELNGVLDGQALLSVLVAHYLCKYDEQFAKARSCFQKLSEDMRKRIMVDTDTFAMSKENPTQLHLALLRCLTEDTPDAMGQLAVAVQQSSSNFDNKAKLLATVHAFVCDVADLAGRTAAGPAAPAPERPPALARRDETGDLFTDLPPLGTKSARPVSKAAPRAPPAPAAQAPEDPPPPAEAPAPLPETFPEAVADPSLPAPAGALPDSSLAGHASPPWSPAEQQYDLSPPPPLPPLRPTLFNAGGHKKRVSFYDEARIGMGMGSDDDPDAPVEVSLLPRRKQPPPRAISAPVSSFSYASDPTPMALDDDDLMALKNSPPLAQFMGGANALSGDAPESDDDGEWADLYGK